MPSQASDALASSKLCFAAASSASLSFDRPRMRSPDLRILPQFFRDIAPLREPDRVGFRPRGSRPRVELRQSPLDLMLRRIVDLQCERLAIVGDGTVVLSDEP